ncbi:MULTISPECIES: ABC transporter substrate-binding protein [unclassified Planococcus (in: firmicutes)]|uniref:ABC transporter substrate-binding protein n=1 Tax=Planococcus TaxID=1372 RepID=UPI000C33E43B|nr:MULTISPECIES: ABC transporter substrate-binding protein [unclassified Planococcus (in: firmicutes)]AUD13145.1 ABC transporter substrate-binding protein [Planococcus sp. MB-3u-03]PKG45373.1 ABC transporter substrate-binding protein [Planococcus sp. Urea-trap-24]PKG89031.1 ABC transporter substrate-binding protein [Planococcus sp. Urea-3u-39]PKH36399.1 ABC transporter substrate-binding protein [Planococcus sp. MB-3u-09]
MSKRYLLFTLWFALAMGLAACSDDNADGGEASGSGDNAFIFARGADSVSLDPAEVTDSESENVAQSLLETLVTFEEGETTVAPLLAVEWQESEDGLTYTFDLRQDVKFHDGTDFDADAVVANFQRWMTGEADQFPMYGSVFGGYEGDEAHIVDSVEAQNDHSVQITLNQVKPTFLKDLALTPFSISSPTAIEEQGEEYSTNPVGTGPFVFEEWLRNDRVVMNKNEDYWLEGYPKLDSVIIRAIPDNSARLNALLSGEVDMIDGVDPDSVEQIESTEGLRVLSRPPLNIGYLGLTVTREPFDDKLVRQAFNHAIDKEAMVDGLFAGQAEPAKNPIPPSVEGYNDSIEAYDYDPEKAKELLAEAGYPDGFEMELWAMPVPRPYMPDANKVAEFLQSNLAEIGVTANIVSYEWATYLDRAKKGEADAFILGWTGTNGDADDFIYSLWHEDNIGDLNSTQYANEELNQVLEEARTITDQERRNELYREAQEIMYEDPPIVPLVHPTPLMAAKSTITGFDPHPTGRLITTKIEFE